MASRILNLVFFFFAVLGGIDYFLDNKFGIGEEFERGISCAGKLILSMMGFMTLAPVLGNLVGRLCGPALIRMGSDPSLMAGILFSVDGGAVPAASSMALTEDAAIINGYFVSAMFGSAFGGNAVLSLLAIDKGRRNKVLFGLALGFASVPFGCIVGASMLKISVRTVLTDLFPLLILSAALFLLMGFCSSGLLKALKVFGKFNVGLCIAGILITAAGELCGFEVLPERYPFDEMMIIIGQIVLVLAGVFPLLGIILRLVSAPIQKLSDKTGLSTVDIKGLFMDMVNCFSSIDRLPEMTDMGVVLNTAFGVGAGYALGDHFAYVTSAAPQFAIPVVLAKLSAGIVSIIAAVLLKKFIINTGK